MDVLNNESADLTPLVGDALWEFIQSEAKSLGLTLFDMDIPKSASGVFRVFIAKDESGRASVGVDDCVRLTKRLTRDEVEPRLPGGTIEVSSPGINRRLRTAVHFAGAVGERVRATAVNAEGTRTHTGLLSKFENDCLFIKLEGDGGEIALPRVDVKDARIEFLF